MTANTWEPNQHTTRTFRNLSILHGGAAGGVLAEHTHSDVQVSVHFLPRSRSDVEPLHLHLYPSLLPHTGSWKPGNEVLVFHLATNLLIEVRQELSRGVDFELVPTRATRDCVLEGLGLIARDEFHSADNFSGLYIESVGNMMARHLLRKHAVIPMPETRAYGLSDQELGKLYQFVHEHLHVGFSVRELAGAIETGPGVLTQKLIRSLGLSPWRFVQRQRILRAKAMLRNGRQSIVEVAVQLGYADQSHFTNTFRRATGVTPAVYRGDPTP